MNRPDPPSSDSKIRVPLSKEHSKIFTEGGRHLESKKKTFYPRIREGTGGTFHRYSEINLLYYLHFHKILSTFLDYVNILTPLPPTLHLFLLRLGLVTSNTTIRSESGLRQKRGSRGGPKPFLLMFFCGAFLFPFDVSLEALLVVSTSSTTQRTWG